MQATIEVLQPGLFSTIQDEGRRGYLRYGVPLAGPMDSFSAGMANMLLQNPPNAAVLEITLMGPKLKFSGASEIAIFGAFLSPKLNGEEIANNKIYRLSGGDILSFGRRVRGNRAYLAVKNGFQTEEVLGSRSWFSGITSAVKLEKGMKLEYDASGGQVVESNSLIKVKGFITSEVIEVFEGPEFSQLPQEKKEELQNRHFSIDINNNRMGIQLQEEVSNDLKPILTGPVLPGTVQLTPSGKLIVLMRDGQTTGGYPRVMQLSEKGINSLAQKVQAEKVRFSFRK